MQTGYYDGLSSKKGFLDNIMQAMHQSRDVSEKKSRRQSENCTAFIKWYGKIYGSQSPNEGEEELLILPFETVSQLYEEYLYTCRNENSSNPASKSTFKRSYTALKKQGLVRLTRGKGTFPTCDICNNANDLLANTKMSPQIRELIVQYKVRTNKLSVKMRYKNIHYIILANASETTSWRTCCA